MIMTGILTTLTFLPLLTAVIVYFLGAYSEKAAKLLTILTAAVTLALSIWLFLIFDKSVTNFQFLETMNWSKSFGLTYVLGIDGISLPLVIISTLLTLLAATGSIDLIAFKTREYYALLLVFETAMIGVFVSLNLVLFYVFWELVLIPMFFFIGIWGGPRKKYAAMKFLIFTHVGSTIMLLGFIGFYVWSPTHSFDLLDLAQLKLPLTLQIFIALTTFFGFAVKLPAVPFHTWLPDAHVEAPAPISVLLAGLLLKMGGYGFIRFNVELLPEASKVLAPFYIGVGLLTMFYGAMVAMIQQDLKRMIALTSINHMGYVLLGAFTLNSFGIAGAVFQMFSHACAIGALFLLSGVIQKYAGTRIINELPGLSAKMPRSSLLLILASLAAMGIPGFSNFISEYMVFVGAISANWFYIVAIAAPMMTVSYFLWMMRRVIITKPAAAVKPHDATWYTLGTLTAFIAPIMVLGFYPAPLLDVINPAAQKLLLAYR